MMLVASLFASAQTKRYAHMHISVSGNEKNHKPTCEECVRHHPKRNVPNCSYVYMFFTSTLKEITALR